MRRIIIGKQATPEHYLNPAGEIDQKLPRFVSVKKLKEIFSIDTKTAKNIRGIVKNTIDPEKFESVKRWIARCFGKPKNIELRLKALNECICAHGVEHFEAGNFYYINTGDIYNATIIYFPEDKFVISTVGDVREKLGI